MTSKANSYQVTMPDTPGARPTTVKGLTLREARQIAAEQRSRRDLTYQDIRIERANGKLYEYAGPAR